MSADGPAEPPSHRAARLVHETGINFAAAGRAFTPPISREAVRQAYARLYPGVPSPHRVGAPATGRRTRQISVRAPGTNERIATLRLSTAELESLRGGAERLGIGIGPWLASLLETWPVPAGADLSTHLREIGLATARVALENGPGAK